VTLGLVLVEGALAWWKWGITEEARWHLRRAWASVKGFQWRILFVLMAVALALTVIATVIGDQSWDAGIMNLGTELAGAAATYWLLQQIIGRRLTKEQLIARMGSSIRDVAVPAADELRRQGWLIDGSLEGAWLVEANLERANLNSANLKAARLSRARLGWATLIDADLQAADLRAADLRGAVLAGADLRMADLSGAPFEHYPDSSELNVTARQLVQAHSLAGATLPGRFRLSEDNWRAEFEEWRTYWRDWDDRRKRRRQHNDQ
jgi:hypothetical protein